MENFINLLENKRLYLLNIFCKNILNIEIPKKYENKIKNNKNIKEIILGHFILEFPIDVCLVVITIIITGFMKEPNLSFGVILVVFSLIISIICCIFRRISIKYSYDENINYKPWLFGLLEIIIASMWIFWVYSQIV